MKKRLIGIILILVIVAMSCTLVACNQTPEEKGTLRFAAPEGSPALAMLTLPQNNKIIDGYTMDYAVVKPANIASEMASKSADIVIMPVNAGSNLIRQGAEYTLVGTAVNGSLYMIGKTENGGTISNADLQGKKIACIGQTGVPGVVFRYVMSSLGINASDVEYVADGQAAMARLNSGDADFIVVGEPAATAAKAKLGNDKVNAELSLQEVYKQVSGKDSYPQAGIFVKNSIAKNSSFMTALFEALEDSREWAIANAKDVTAYAKEHLYEGAAFPAPSIVRCAINGQRLDEIGREEVLAFLKAVMPKDSQGNAIDWDSVANKIFGLN